MLQGMDMLFETLDVENLNSGDAALYQSMLEHLADDTVTTTMLSCLLNRITVDVQCTLLDTRQVHRIRDVSKKTAIYS